TTHRVCAARKRRSFMRVMRLRKSTCPAPSAPCTWNTCFAMSKPIVVACSMDASFGGSSTPSPWHTNAVGGRPPHHPPDFGRAADEHIIGGLGIRIVPALVHRARYRRPGGSNQPHSVRAIPVIPSGGGEFDCPTRRRQISARRQRTGGVTETFLA